MEIKNYFSYLTALVLVICLVVLNITKSYAEEPTVISDSHQILSQCLSEAATLKVWMESTLIPALRKLGDGDESLITPANEELSQHIEALKLCYGSSVISLSQQHASAFYEVATRLVLPQITLEERRIDSSACSESIEYVEVAIQVLEKLIPN